MIVAGVVILVGLLLVTATVQSGLVWKTVSSTRYGGWGIDLKGNLLYIAAFYAVWVLDISDLSHPQAKGVWQSGSVPSGPFGFLRANGPLIYYGNLDGSFSILTVSPGRIDRLSLLRTNMTVSDLERTGTTVLLAGDTWVPGRNNPIGSVLGINVTDPRTPSESFRVWRPTPVIDAAVQDGFLYLVTDAGDFEVWRLQMSGPTYVGSLHLRDPGQYGAGLSAVGVDGLRAVVTVRDIAGVPGVFLLNLTSPLVVMQFLPMRANANGVVLTPNLAFVSLFNGVDTPERQVAICPIDAQGRLRLEQTIGFARNLGMSLAVNPSADTIFALGEDDLAIAAKVPTTLFEDNATVRWGFLFAAIVLTGATVGLVLRGKSLIRKSRGENRETVSEKGIGP